MGRISSRTRSSSGIGRSPRPVDSTPSLLVFGKSGVRLRPNPTRWANRGSRQPRDRIDPQRRGFRHPFILRACLRMKPIGHGFALKWVPGGPRMVDRHPDFYDGWVPSLRRVMEKPPGKHVRSPEHEARRIHRRRQSRYRPRNRAGLRRGQLACRGSGSLTEWRRSRLWATSRTRRRRDRGRRRHPVPIRIATGRRKGRALGLRLDRKRRLFGRTAARDWAVRSARSIRVVEGF